MCEVRDLIFFLKFNYKYNELEKLLFNNKYKIHELL